MITLLCFATVYVPNNFYRPIFIKYYSTMSSINIVWSVNQLPKTITILHFRVYANKRTINSANGFELLVVQTWIVMFVISFPKNIDASEQEVQIKNWSYVREFIHSFWSPHFVVGPLCRRNSSNETTLICKCCQVPFPLFLLQSESSI